MQCSCCATGSFNKPKVKRPCAGVSVFAQLAGSADRTKCCYVQAQRVKAQRDMEEVQGLTFHPAISRHAQTVWGPHEVGSVPAWQRLSKGQDEGSRLGYQGIDMGPY